MNNLLANVVDVVKETEKLHDILEKTNDEVDLRGPLSRVTGKIDDLRSDEVESQIAISFGKTDIYKEKGLFLLAWHGCDAAIVF